MLGHFDVTVKDARQGEADKIFLATDIDI